MKREEIESRIKTSKTEIKGWKASIKRHKQDIDRYKKQLEELPKLEVGKWYRLLEHKKALICYVDNRDSYGFGVLGMWCIDFRSIESLSVVKATPQEVQTALIKEAKKRGFKEGVTANCFNNFKPQSDIGFKFISIDNGLLFQNQCIFLNGKWATIIEQKKVSISGDYTKEDLEKIIQTEFNQ